MTLLTPKSTGTVSITSATSTARVALVPTGANQVSIKNVDATNVAFVEFGDSTVVAVVPSGATPGSMAVGPGERVGVSIGAATHVAAICGAGTPIVYFTPGRGSLT